MATRTISALGGNWNSTATWVEAIVPVNGDDVVSLGGGLSGQLTVNVASACTSIDFTGYTNTITFNATLTTAGTTKFVTGMTIAGSSGIELSTTCTFTTAGLTIPTLLMSGASKTITLADDCNVSGNFNFNCSSTSTINSNTLYVAGNVASPNATNWNGTFTLYFNGTGAQSFNSFNNTNINITFGGTGTISITGTFWSPITGTIKHIVGATVIPSSTTQMGGGNSTLTLDCPGITWGTITPTGNCTYSLTSDLNCKILSTANSIALLGTGNFNIAQFSCNNTTGVGTVKITSVGGLPCTLTTGAGLGIASNLIIDCDVLTISTLTLSGNSATATYRRGKVTVTGTLAITVSGYTLIGFNKIKWQTINITAGVSVSMNYFFCGTSDNIVTVQSTSTTSNATVILNGGIPSVSPFTRVSNITCQNNGSQSPLYCINRSGNKGGNIGIIFGEEQTLSFPQKLTERSEKFFGWTDKSISLRPIPPV